MKNHTVNAALAAFFAFVSAVVYIILYMLELLPGAALIAVIGVVTALIALVVLSLISAVMYSRRGAYGYSGIGCCGRLLAWAAIVCLCLSVLLLIVSTVNAMLYTAVLFFAVFSWKFLLFVWVLFLICALPDCRSNDNCPTR